MTEAEIKTACLELIETAEIAYVTSIGNHGYPYTRAMFNLRNKEQFPKQAILFSDQGFDFMTLFTTNTSSLKMSQIVNNPKVSVYYCHPKKFQGLMLSGDIQIVDDSDLRHAVWNEGWERYYPNGPDDPDHTILRLNPKFATGWYTSSRFFFKLGDV